MWAPVTSINESAPQISAMRAMILIAICAAGPRSPVSCELSSSLRFNLIAAVSGGVAKLPVIQSRARWRYDHRQNYRGQNHTGSERPSSDRYLRIGIEDTNKCN